MEENRLIKEPNLAIMLDVAAHTMNNYHNAVLDEYGITTKQSKVLTYLVFHQSKEINQKDIEKKFFLRGSTVTSVMKNLEKAGFIERHSSKIDKRSKQIIVTKKGYEVHEKVHLSLKGLQDTLMEGWTKEQAETFFILIEDAIGRFSEKSVQLMQQKSEDK